MSETERRFHQTMRLVAREMTGELLEAHRAFADVAARFPQADEAPDPPGGEAA